MRSYPTLALGLALAALSPAVTLADQPLPQAASTAADDLPALVASLDAESFEERSRAGQTLAELIADSDDPAWWARALRRQLLVPDISFEVRAQLTRLIEQLPAASIDSAETSPDEVAELIAQLDDDSYAVRVGAAARLEWLLGQSELASETYTLLKAHGNAAATDTGRRQLERLTELARGAWLLSDPATWSLPEVSDREIEAWIDAVCAAAPRDRAAREWAERELLDLLARDDEVERVASALQRRLDAGGLTQTAADRVEALLHWTQPALIAEFWQMVDKLGGAAPLPTPTRAGDFRDLAAQMVGVTRRNLGVQYLLVDVPSFPEGGRRASHFDRVDDRVANCVSGNSLSPGEYPVGVAFPHPDQDDAFFHLVSLPTPHRRQAYEFERQRSDEERLIEISRRTLGRMLSEQRRLTQREALMLALLDPAEVSRFAGQYFPLVEDGPFAEGAPTRSTLRLGLHAAIAYVLAHYGTHDAVPGLLEAIDSGRLEPVTTDLCWLAALGIAHRDPWPEVDRWLASLLERTEVLLNEEPEAVAGSVAARPRGGPELGATAAALLLKRAGILPSTFGLQPSGPQLLLTIGCPGHRFTNEDARAELLAWWENADTRRASQAAHGAARQPTR